MYSTRSSGEASMGWRDRRRVCAAAIAVVAGMAFAPASAAAQQPFPLYGKDKFLGNVNELTRPLFAQYFNQITPENAGKWGSAAGTTRTAAMRWANLDQAYNLAQANGWPFNFHVLVWGNQQPTWMAALSAEEQLVEIKKWFAAVAERYPNIKWIQVVNEPLHDPPDCTHSANQGGNCNASGNYARALGGANGTDGTGWDWILNAFRLAKQYFPNTKLMLNDYSITNSDSATTQYLQIINILKRENLLDAIGEQGHAFSTTGNMAVHKANLDRLAATGHPDPDQRTRHRRRRRGRRPRRRDPAARVPPDRPGLLGAPGRRGHHGLGLAPTEPLAQRAERADRALHRRAEACRALAL